MRQRTKMSGLVSHNKPSGSSFQSKRNRCEMNIKKLENLITEGYKLTGVKRAADATPKEVEVAIFGGKVRMTFAEYQEHGQGLKILMEIF